MARRTVLQRRLRLLPWLPVRQWVLSVPKRLRPYLHHKPEVASGVLRIFLRVIRSTLRDASPNGPAGVRDARIGAASFLHRFGSSLNAHFHYHVVVLDGVLSEAPDEPAGQAAGLRAPERPATRACAPRSSHLGAGAIPRFLRSAPEGIGVPSFEVGDQCPQVLLDRLSA